MKLMRLAITCWIGLVLGVAAHEFGRAAASATTTPIVTCFSDRDGFPTCDPEINGKGPCHPDYQDSFCMTLACSYIPGYYNGKYCACVRVDPKTKRTIILYWG